MRRTHFYYLCIAVISILIFLIVIGKQTKDVNVSNLRAVPINAPLVIEIEDVGSLLEKLNRESLAFSGLKKSGVFEGFFKNIFFLDSLIKNNKTVEEFLYKKKLTLSLHIEGRDKIEPLFLLDVRNFFEENSAKSYLLSLLGNDFKITSSQLDGINVFEAILKEDDNKSLYFSFDAGMVFFSSSKVVVENSLMQNKADISLLDNNEFLKVAKTTGRNVDANIYVNCRTFPKFLKEFVSKKQKGFLNKFTDFADWAELDVNIGHSDILLNGFSAFDDFKGKYLGLFTKQKTGDIKVDRILPRNISTFVSIHCSDFDLFHKDYSLYLEKVGKYRMYKANLDRINKLSGLKVQEVFYRFLEGEIAVAKSPSGTYAVLKTKSKGMAQEGLAKIVKGYMKNTRAEVGSLYKDYVVDEKNKFTIHRMPIGSIMERIFGSLFEGVHADYYIFIDNFLIFGTSYNSLVQLIKSNIRKSTLYEDSRYREFKEGMSSDANFFLYFNPRSSKEIFPNYFSEAIVKGVNKNGITIENFQALGFQFSGSKGMVYNNLYLKFNSGLTEETPTTWQSRLDATIHKSFKPQLVTNHYSKNKEVFLQDVNNVLYLINYEGQVLWKRSIEGKIIGEVYQIDLYKNNKLQLLFNTENRVYLIDRNGNDVERFPIALKAKATNGLSVFDYDKNKDYRILVACEDKRIYNYDKTGKLVSGWNVPITDNFVKSPIRHFKFDGKDYIVFVDSYKVYILNRKGNTRVKVKESFEVSENAEIYLNRGNRRFVTTDSRGHIRYIYFTGDMEIQRVGNFSDQHFFIFNDINGNKRGEYIFVDKGRLEVYDDNFSKMFDFSFDKEVSSKPFIYSFSSSNKQIGITDVNKGLVYLINNKGKLRKNFPLNGYTPFSIGYTRKQQPTTLYLFTGSDDGYLYSYEIKP